MNIKITKKRAMEILKEEIEAFLKENKDVNKEQLLAFIKSEETKK
jgi:hypothetical protein